MADATKPGVCVFAPSPQFTVTVEEAGDGEAEVHFHPGGQGFWVARMTTLLGARTSMCSAFGGESGQIVRLLLEAEGIDVQAVEGSAPNGGYIHDRRSGEREPVVDTQSPTLTRHEIDDLYNLTVSEAIASGVCVLTGNTRDGVVPANIYGRLAKDLGGNGVRIIADISGEDLRSLEGGVHVLKVSHEDLLRDGFVESVGNEDLAKAMQDLRSIADHIVITRADQPAWALLSGKLVSINPPRFEPLDHRGAGDSLTAATAAGLASGLKIEDALKLGAAAGALNVTRHGLGSGRRDSVETLAKKVRIKTVELESAGSKATRGTRATAANTKPKKEAVTA